LLLPPSLHEWLPEDHLAWFVIDAVAAMDLTAFYAAYRADGHGRAAHDPAMMVALCSTPTRLASGPRGASSGAALRMSPRAWSAPTSSPITRRSRVSGSATRRRLPACSARCSRYVPRPGWCRLGWSRSTARSWTRTRRSTWRSYEDIAREILAEADAVDAQEDEEFGERRGDELPPELATAQGRRGWLREAKRRLEEEHEVECRANADYEAYRARGRMKDGRRFGRPPNPYRPPATPVGKINVTDPDSRNVKTSRGWVQG
jgi:hypothetical protein